MATIEVQLWCRIMFVDSGWQVHDGFTFRFQRIRKPGGKEQSGNTSEELERSIPERGGVGV